MTTPAPNDDLVRKTERHAESVEALRRIADTLGREGDDGSRVCIRQLSDDFERIFKFALTAQAERISVLERALEPFAKEARLWAGYDEAEILVEGFPNGPASSITVGDLYRANTTLTGAR